jgi:hypothetical protein
MEFSEMMGLLSEFGVFQDFFPSLGLISKQNNETLMSWNIQKKQRRLPTPLTENE